MNAQELMKAAKKIYKQVDNNFGIAKSLMMYVQIDLSKHCKDLQSKQKEKLVNKLT